MSITIDVKGLQEGLIKIDALSGEKQKKGLHQRPSNTAIPKKYENAIVDKKLRRTTL